MKRIEVSDADFVKMIMEIMDLPDYQNLLVWKILEKKLDQIVEHDLYSKYKTAPTPEQKERARIAYLEKKGIPTSFRW